VFGYYGKFLDVNLSTGDIKDLNISEQQTKAFIGGASLSAALLYKYVKAGMNPLAAENPLVFATGPFVGTTIPMVSRSSVCAVSPLTGYWGEATTGGIFPFRLKATGYDGIFVTGKANKPVYLYLNDGKAEIRDASSLWGKNSCDTQELIKAELQQKRLSISCIADGGENLVKYAAVMNDEGRTAGRTGMGTLMGSKMLKAIAVTGTQKAPVADPAQVLELTKQMREALISRRASMYEYGTMGYLETAQIVGDLPGKYFQSTVFPIRRVTANAFRKKYTIENYACFGCPTACGRTLKLFKKGLDEIDGPEYETADAFGPLCWNFDTDAIIYANHYCNVHGIDTITAGVTIAFAMYLYDKGILTEKRAGMKIEWGDSKAILKLLELIVKRKGIGDLLAEGTLAVARSLGVDPNEAAQVKGLEIPMHDPRMSTGQAISYATGSRGACHLRGDYYATDLGGNIKEYDIKAMDRFQSEGKAAMAAKLQDYKDLFDSVLACKFSNYTPTETSAMLNAVTGWQTTPLDILKTGERSMNLKRAISNKLGVTRELDKMPQIAIEPLPDGSTAGKSPDMDVLLKEYYEYRQWDWDTGKPKKPN